MKALSGCIAGVGLAGPGLSSWSEGRSLLAPGGLWRHAPTVVPQPQCLPATERRRTPSSVKLALAVGLEACAGAGADPAQVASVFASSGADGQNCHEICEALASSERLISPTRFHNSVHNAAAGYWGIATGATAAASALCAYDASFAAGLLEALAQVQSEDTAVLLVAYDAGYPEPIRARRSILGALAVALVLSPAGGRAPLARIEANLTHAPPEKLAAPLEQLRRGVPAARSLPLLALLASATAGTAVLEYLGATSLGVAVSPCR